MKPSLVLSSILLLVSFSLVHGQTTAGTPVAVTATTTAAAVGSDCQTYSKLDSLATPIAANDSLISTIVVPDDFKIGSVAVKDIRVTHSRVGALKISLSASPLGENGASASSLAPSVVLKDVRSGSTGANLNGTAFDDSAAAAFPADAAAAPFPGTWKPAANLSAAFAGLPSAAGSWSLRVVDLGDKRDGRTIQLTGWTLVLCPAEGDAEDAEDDEAGGADADAADDDGSEEDAANDGAAAPAAAAAPVSNITITTGSGAAPAAGGNASGNDTRAGAIGTGLGLLEQLLNRITRVDDNAPAAGTGAAANGTATAGDDTTALSDEDARLVDRLLNRLAELNVTRPGAAMGLGGRADGIRDGGFMGAGAGTNGSRTEPARSMWTWRLGDVTVDDSDGVVSAFLSSLSDVLYSLANSTRIANASGSGSDSEGELAGALANVTVMAQSAFRSLAEQPSRLRSMIPDYFSLDFSQRMIDALPSRSRSRLTKWINDYAANVGALADLTGTASANMRASALDTLQSAASVTNAFHNASRTAAGAARGFYKEAATLHRNATSVADYAADLSKLQQQLMADQVAAYTKAVQTASSVARNRMADASAKMASAAKSILNEIAAMRKQLSSMRLLGGSAASAAITPAMDRLTAVALTMGQASVDLRSSADKSFGETLSAFNAQVPATGQALGVRTAAVTDTSGGRFGMSLDALSGAMDRLNSGFESLTAGAGARRNGTIVGRLSSGSGSLTASMAALRNGTALAGVSPGSLGSGRVATAATETRQRGLDMMEAAVAQMQERLQEASKGPREMAADVRDRVNDMLGQLGNTQERIRDYRRTLLA
ncbi:hypothetical protein GPECTOR_53g158 [Gonium pectorale]|uniref:P/Homo B domain-containing protein n=1 Tax=Gonium pectorale TaxID=33097 RepID=A0A150G6U8_GONPE|nr:hypothetical protein GPECTOR_53g158 [Gonium pectorale]|eukprot:KXZ45572.1 hypothetical protein GPECTOR_53g158 [Gonium pectorale]